MRNERAIGLWALITSCGCVFVVSASLRIAFVREVLNEYAQLPHAVQTSQRYGFLTPDSMSYLEPAGRAAVHDFLHSGSLLRPPGYPVFLAICGQSPSHMLIAQALLGSFIPIATLLLTFYLLRNLRLSVVAGLVSSFSPTGVGITGLIMSDLLFAVLFAAGFLSLLYAAARHGAGWLLPSALLFGIAGLVRPVLSMWPVVAAVIWWLLRRSENQSFRWPPVAMLVCVQVACLTGWSTCNYLRDGVFTVSEIGPFTTRAYLAARVEEWARAGDLPSEELVRDNVKGVTRRLFSHRHTASQRMDAYRDESARIFWSHPGETLRVFVRNIEENTVAGWNYFPAQFPTNPSLRERGLGLSTMESSVRTYARWPVTLGFIPFLVVARCWPTPENRRLLLQVVALSLAYVYFGLSCGLTFWTGSRILYPGEMLAIAIATMEIHLLIRLPRSLRLYLQQERGGRTRPATRGEI